MRRLFWFDMNLGIWKKKWFLLFPFLLAPLLMLQFYFHYRLLSINFGSLLMYVYGGCAHYDPTFGQAFELPMAWMIVILLPAYYVLTYPVEDLLGSGRDIVVRCGARWKWWLSKCAWAVTSAVYFHVMLLLNLLVWTRIFDLPISLSADRTFLSVYFRLEPAVFQKTPRITISGIIILMLAFITLHLIALCLLLFLKEEASFALLAGYLLLSAYFFSPWLVGHYASVARAGTVMYGGYHVIPAAVYLLVVCLLAVGIGFWRFRFYDILGSE